MRNSLWKRRFGYKTELKKGMKSYWSNSSINYAKEVFLLGLCKNLILNLNDILEFWFDLEFLNI